MASWYTNSMEEETQRIKEMCLQEQEEIQKERAQYNEIMEQWSFLLKENRALWMYQDTLHGLHSKMKEDLNKLEQESLSYEKVR